MLQMVHPDRVVDEAGLAKLPLVEPVYPLTEGLGLERRCARPSTARSAKLPDAAGMAGRGLAVTQRISRPSPTRSQTLHRPHEPADIAPEGPAWTRLAYDELLAGQLALALVRAHQRSPPGRGSAGDGHLRAQGHRGAALFADAVAAARASTTSSPTSAQPQRMLRLLQGDVGSGKTVVALLAAATVIEAGRQAALMAPTEILARQHLTTIAPLAGSRRHPRRAS